MIRLSQSSLTTYLKCPKMFWYAYIKRLEKRIFNINFFVGNVTHEGMHLTYRKDDNFFELLGKYFDQTLEQEREKHLFSPEEEAKIEEWKIIILGMIYAYNMKNHKLIQEHTHIKNEQEIILTLAEDLEFVIKIDNILQNTAGEHFIHEVKTTRELNENYVDAIKYQIQVAIYYYLSQMIDGFKPRGIIYDVLQKPSIRLKKGERREQYLDRLEAYYSFEPDKRLWTEVIEKPGFTKEDVMTTIFNVRDAIKEQRFHKSYQSCGMCDFKKLCVNEDSPEFMLAYSIKEEKENGTIAN